VLAAIGAIPRHIFIDEALASRAYEDTALPIGFEQTISQPFVVARMLEALRGDKPLSKCSKSEPAAAIRRPCSRGSQSKCIRSSASRDCSKRRAETSAPCACRT